MKKSRMARNDAGTTMIELVIATAVFLAGGVSLMGGLVTLTVHNRVADQRARASTFSTSTFEDLRGRTITQILAYNMPVDNPDTGTVNVAGIGTATASAFAVLPDGAGGFSSFQLGVDNPAQLDVNNLPNPIEIRIVLTPEGGNYANGQYSQMHYASTTMVSY